MYLRVIGLSVLFLACAHAEENEAPSSTSEVPALASVEEPISTGDVITVGQEVPPFALPAIDGSVVNIADYADKTVVLEWFNPGCPYVKHVHNEGEMIALANAWMGRDVVWLAINSGRPGKQGTGQETNLEAAQNWNLSYPILLDETGAVGQRFGAKTTPHMFVIHEGTLVYQGAYSNAPMGDVARGEELQNYVALALTSVQNGQPVDSPESKAWGCSVKY